MSQPIRILYVDDYPLDRELVRDALEKEHQGFIVAEATSRADFEARLAEGGFDLVLTDFNILGFEGLQVLDAVRATHPRTPVVVVTGTGSEAVAVEALKSGAADYVIKTTKHIRRLPETIYAALERQRLQEEHAQADQQLRESEERFRATINQAPVGIAHLGTDGHWLLVNQQLCDIVGYTPAEMLARTVQDLIHPDDLGTEFQHRRQLLANDVQTYTLEQRFIRKDVSPVWISWTVSLVHAPSGDPDYLIAIIEDITARKHAEQEIARLNQHLGEQANELRVANEGLEAFNLSLTQDLRAPLVVIRNMTSLILKDYPQLPSKVQDLFQLIRANTEEMDELTQGLLQVSRIPAQSLRKQTVAFEELVRAAWDELQAERAGRLVEFTVGTLPAGQADPVLLKQVWVNLLANALKFTRGREVAHIEIGARQEDDRTVYFIRDDGVGFDMAYAREIFRPFQRFHGSNEYEGSGVGLAIVERIIRRHGGRVWAEAQVDQGATFYFTLG
jgi:PAS domain S-box-containing protein